MIQQPPNKQTKYCTICTTVHEHGHEFCADCGKELVLMSCRYPCETILNVFNKYCAACGKRNEFYDDREEHLD